jgi:hypothetical protein
MSTDHLHRAHPARDLRSTAVVNALVDHDLVPAARRDEAYTVVEHVLGRQILTAAAPLRRRFAELAGYVGAALVVSAAGVFFATQWPDLTDLQRITLLVGASVLLAVAGLAVAAAGAGGIASGLAAMRHGARPTQRRLSGVLFIGAAATAAGAVGLQVDRVVDDVTSSAPAFAGFVTLTVLALVGYVLTPTVAGQAAIAFGAFTTVPAGLDLVAASDPIPLGLTVLGVGVLWLVLAERRVWREPWAARIIGCVLALIGAQMPVGDMDRPWVAYLALFVVAVAAFAMYVVGTSWPYLATGVVALTLAVPEALLDWTDNALGPAGVLLVAGLTLLGASLLGLRLRKEVTEDQRT